MSGQIKKTLTAQGIPEAMIEVIYDGIEIPPETPTPGVRKRARQNWDYSDAEFVVGHLGAFTAEKGQDIAISAMEILKQHHPQVRLLLAGLGDTRFGTELRRRAAALGRVKLVGYVSDIASFFAALDLLVMPSRAEGLGSSALLAMGYGVPVVASRAGGLPELVKEGESGWLVEPGSAPALAEAIGRAASDRERLAQMAWAGRERAGKFTLRQMVAKTEALYERLAIGLGSR